MSFEMTKFLEQLQSVKEQMEEAKKEAMTPEETASVAAGAAAEAAPGGDAVAATEAGSEMRGQDHMQAVQQVRAADIADEKHQQDWQHGDNAGDERMKLERQLERLAGQQIKADAEQEQAIDTAAVAPTNATNMAKGAEDAGEDRIASLLSDIHQLLQEKDASEEEADQVVKMASEAIQYGRCMAVGFMDTLRELSQEDRSGEE